MLTCDGICSPSKFSEFVLSRKIFTSNFMEAEHSLAFESQWPLFRNQFAANFALEGVLLRVQGSLDFSMHLGHRTSLAWTIP